MSGFNEKSVIEDYLIKKLMEKGWKYVTAQELERDNPDESILTPILYRSIKKLNIDKKIGPEEILFALNEIRLKGTGIESSKKILNYFKTGIPVKFEKERVIKYVKLFDYENQNNNDYVVSNQVIYQNGDKVIRADIVLFINGIPLVIIECKSSVSFSTNWFHAFKQIKSYEKDIPDLFKYLQIGVAAEQIAKYFPIVPWLEEIKIEEWKEDGKDSIDSIIEMLDPRVLIDIIKNFLFFRIEMGNATKVITRYMQYRAVNKIVDRVINNVEGKDNKNRGLIWHWQGSGKTLIMIFAANKLYNNILLEHPSIYFIVDRIDLEQQLFEEFNALDISSPDIIVSIQELKKALKYDSYRGKKGMMIVLIHKFRPEELNEVMEELEELSKKNETIMTRKNVIGFIDEGHRTQYGVSASQMKNIFKNGFFFALTGTPISKKGRDTYLEFSYLPDEKYLDKYFIIDSLKDGFTIKISYQPRLEKDVHLKKQLLETFLEVEYEDISGEIREKIKEDIRKKLTTIKLFLENPERIKKISIDIAEHFKENIDNKFKAMVIAASREACISYKRELDKVLPTEYSEVVMTFTRDDSPSIKSYLESLIDRYNGKEVDRIRKEIITKFKEDEYPKILIVTDMLLTGFDAPILQTMYLDKPLKEHKLLQAIARTNRPYKDLKESGIIFDYIGILKEFKKAFEKYSKEDLEGAIYDIDQLRNEFANLISDIMSMFVEVPKDRYDRETLLQAIQNLTSNEERGKQFLKMVGQMRRLFELLGPNEIKLRLFSDYKWIIAVYIYYRNLVIGRDKDFDDTYVEKYLQKTLKYVHKTTELEEFIKNLPIFEFDEEFLINLEKNVKSEKEKVANILFTLNRFMLVDRTRNLAIENIADKVNRLMKKWKEKNQDFQSMYKYGVSIIEELNSITERQKLLAFSNLEYSILLALEQRFKEDPSLIEDVRELSTLIHLKIYRGSLSQKTVLKELEAEIRRFLRRYIKRYNIKLQDIDDLSKRIMDVVKNHE